TGESTTSSFRRERVAERQREGEPLKVEEPKEEHDDVEMHVAQPEPQEEEQAQGQREHF
ncbi:hypothetical protein A2U01_0070405, partial [Trifolium medium]|nr:hypothetical protein [Trifolium medium]